MRLYAVIQRPLGFGVLHNLLTYEYGVLVSSEQGPELAETNTKRNYLNTGCEVSQLVQWEDCVEALPGVVQLLPHPEYKHQV